jgi:hypothetical protein
MTLTGRARKAGCLYAIALSLKFVWRECDREALGSNIT